jgi:hypothetical protein
VSRGLDGEPDGSDAWRLDGGGAALSAGRLATALALAPTVALARAAAAGANRVSR